NGLFGVPDPLGNVQLLLGLGDGTFQDGGQINAGGGPTNTIAAGDFNGDHHLDFIANNAIYGTLFVMLGSGDGTFTNAGQVVPAQGTRNITTGDFNGDGRLDVA